MTTPQLIRKSFPAEVKVLDAKLGIVEAYVNTMEVADYDNEVMGSGVFDRVVARTGRLPKLCWSHDPSQTTGKVLETRQVGNQQYIKSHYNLSTQRGREAFSDVEFGAIDEWSVGFYVMSDTYENPDWRGKRYISEIEMWPEVSNVLIGASPGTSTVSAKDRARVVTTKAMYTLDPIAVGGIFSAIEVLEGVLENAGIDPEAEDAEEMMAHLSARIKSVWSTAYVNNLADAAFAAIEAGGSKDSDGKTTPRSLRHFPHHDDSGAVDLPHVRNALARIPQSSVGGALKTKAENHCQAHLDASKAAPPPRTTAITLGRTPMPTEPESDAASVPDDAHDTEPVTIRNGYRAAPGTLVPDAPGTDSALALLERERAVLEGYGLYVPRAKEGRRNNSQDQRRVQILHDLACEMGADCSGDNVPSSEGAP